MLLISDKILPSLKVDGFLGAIIAAIAMLGIFLVQWLLGAIRVQGFQLSGAALLGTITPSLITQQEVGADLLTGGAYGPEGGLVGMAFRFVVIALVLGYLYLRAGRRGSIARLEFPISVYDNRPNSVKPIFRPGRTGASQRV